MGIFSPKRLLVILLVSFSGLIQSYAETKSPVYGQYGNSPAPSKLQSPAVKSKSPAPAKPQSPAAKPNSPAKPQSPAAKPNSPAKPKSPVAAVKIRPETKTCYNRKSPCFLKHLKCPDECPSTSPKNPKAKMCYINCDSPICRAECKNRKPNCNGPGAVCLDPRFIGGDGIVFYFHGKKNEHFSLLSDKNLQINARFIGLRPAGRSRDYTWIQALGLLFDSRNFTLEAIKSENWDDEVDHIKFTYNGNELVIPEGHLSAWSSEGNDVTVERISDRNSVVITVSDLAEISVNVVPITKQEDKIHNYQIPSDDCFAHLEVQFKFLGLSAKVEGVLGRTYQPDFENPAKPGVAMPVVGGDDKYKTTSLLSTDCRHCIFSPAETLNQESSLVKDFGTLDCTSGGTSGNGIVCRK